MVDKSEVVSGALVGGATAATAIYGSPELAILAGTIGPVAHAVLPHQVQRLAGAVDWLARQVAPEGQDALARHLESRPAAAALLVDAAHAIARTEYRAKIDAIGRAIAEGLLYEDGVSFDVGAHVVRIIGRLERPHVLTLRAMAADEDGTKAEELAAAYPNLALVASGLLAELVGSGLAENGPDSGGTPGTVRLGQTRITDLGRRVLEPFEESADGHRAQGASSS